MEGFTSDNIEKLGLDVTSDNAVERVVQMILDKEGRIDIVVNNAGVLGIGMLVRMFPEWHFTQATQALS
jgi:1-acylglycerone phosphate reductase